MEADGNACCGSAGSPIVIKADLKNIKFSAEGTPGKRIRWSFSYPPKRELVIHLNGVQPVFWKGEKRLCLACGHRSHFSLGRGNLHRLKRIEFCSRLKVQHSGLRPLPPCGR